MRPSHDPFDWRLEPPRRPRRPLWRRIVASKPAAVVYLVVLLWVTYLLDTRYAP